MVPTALCCLLSVLPQGSPAAPGWQLSWARGARVKAVQSPRQMGENLHFPVLLPTAQSSPQTWLEWRGPSEPLQGDNSSWSSQEPGWQRVTLSFFCFSVFCSL